MSDEHHELINQFCQLTQAHPDNARQFLEASNWDLMTAANRFFEEEGGQGEDDDTDYEEEGASKPTTQSAESSTQGGSGFSSKARGPVTLGDLGRKSQPVVDDDDDEEEQDLNYFAGGEKSGLAIKTPGERRGAIEDILKKAVREHGRHEEDSPGPSGHPRSYLTGVGRTLGSEDTPSITIPDSSARQQPEFEIVRRDLTFWRDGMSVDDGPLLRYDDPANAAIINSIQQGRAPTELMNIGIGQKADVHVHKRFDEDYVPPKKKRQPFSGAGIRLGSPTPGVAPSSSASSAAILAAPSTTPSSSSPPTGSKSAPSVPVDSSIPTTTLRIRLGDGTNLVSRFNHAHTVGDLYGFVNAASLESRSRNYVLQTTFPNKELKDHDASLEDAGLLNTNIVQKWV